VASNCGTPRAHKEEDPRSEATDPMVSPGRSCSQELGRFCLMEVMAHHQICLLYYNQLWLKNWTFQRSKQSQSIPGFNFFLMGSWQTVNCNRRDVDMILSYFEKMLLN
jgi:hypothetical protein